MEKISKRFEYSLKLYEICQKVDLNQILIDGLSEHKYFKEEMKTVMKFPDETTRKVFILLEFTRLRSTCEEIIKLLRSCRQMAAAEELEYFNTSPGRMTPVSTSAFIEVIHSKAEMKGSLIYQMTKNPRGKCIIILNEPKLTKELERFESVFSQLYFTVEKLVNLKSARILDELETLAKDKALDKTEAFVLMIIGHGANEGVIGFDNKDSIPITEIVDIFSEKNCLYLKQTPKLFFFNCCRAKEFETSFPRMQQNQNQAMNLGPDSLDIQLTRPNERPLKELITIKKEWLDQNKDTFISYSCSEGSKAYFDEKIGISAFGQALSHSIAQYACEESLQSIMSRTCDFMESEEVVLCQKSAPELRGRFMRRQLFFNPGFSK